MYLLGIHDGHNASAVLMKDGKIIDAVQEERFNKIKNFGGFPKDSILYILKKNNLDFNQIEQFIFASLIAHSVGQENRKRVLEKNEKNFNSNI
jgi:carbamoyltransferase